MKAALAALLSILLAGCASAPAAQPPLEPANACAISGADRAWIDRSLEAWRFASREISNIASVPRFRAIFFDASCVLASDNALTIDTPVDRVTWSSAPHAGMIPLPNGEEAPAGVTSFASGAGALTYFVMSTPSVWREGDVSGGPMPLETMMVAVLLHEASHVAQIGPYGPRLGRLIEQNALPESFSDDSLQHHFQANDVFAASVAQETALFMQAAGAANTEEARRLAREARALMRTRAQRWFTGADAYYAEAEDIWLTFEGAGQWTAYQWLVHPEGGAISPADANERFVHGRWWSQTEGFAVVSALHRIVGRDWRRHAYGDGAYTVLEMLDSALAAP